MNNGIIKKIRQKYKMNQTEFAKLLGICQANLSGLENGKRMPTSEIGCKLLKIAKNKGMKMHLEDLFFPQEDEEKKQDE